MSLLPQQMKDIGALIDAELDKLLPEQKTPEKRIAEAMRYSAISSGKKIRPFLVVSSSDLFGVPRASSIRVAAAREMLHCYSLIHDDLPCMDDDDLRRGKPTCHKKFDEATAVLAGDALLTRAFDVLAMDETHTDPSVRCQLVVELAKAAGYTGMIGGQMLDILSPDLEMDVAEITRMQQMKTGRLISFACEAGAIMGKAPFKERQALKAYARDIGLCFQIKDDILDVEGNPADVGKTVRKDLDAHKATFISLLGLDRAKEQAKSLCDQAIASLDMFDKKADVFRELARFIVERRS